MIGADYTVAVDGATAVQQLFLSSANATLGGTGPLTVGSGGFNWSAGTIATTVVTASGNLGTSTAGLICTIAATGTLRLTSGNSFYMYGQLTNAGTLDTGSGGPTIVVEQGSLILDTGSTMSGTAVIRLEDFSSVTLNGSAPFTSIEVSLLGGIVQGSGTHTGKSLSFYQGSISGVTLNVQNINLVATNSKTLINATINQSSIGSWNTSCTLTAQGTSRWTIQPGALLQATPTGFGGLGGTAALATTAGGTFQFENNGTINLGANVFTWGLSIGNGVTFSNGGTLSAQGSNVSVAAGATFENTGVIFATTSTLNVPDTATLTNFSAGTLTGGTWQLVNTTVNFGTRQVTTIGPGTSIELNGASTSFPALAGLTQNNGTLLVTTGATFTPTAATVATAGTIEAGPGGTFAKGIAVQSGGTVTGAGTVTGVVAVQPGGRLAPGNGVGTLTVNAPVTVNGGTGTIWDVSFTGVAPNTPATASTQASRLALSGSATLNLAATSADKITLNLMQVGGTLTPQQPVSYVIATAASGSNFQTNGGGFSFDPSQFDVTFAGFGGVTTFDLSVVGNDLVIQFIPVPEPVSVLAIAFLVPAIPLGVGKLRKRLVAFL
jgi:fibronectin-binding autotransporter adhesin